MNQRYEFLEFLKESSLKIISLNSWVWILRLDFYSLRVFFREILG